MFWASVPHCVRAFCQCARSMSAGVSQCGSLLEAIAGVPGQTSGDLVGQVLAVVIDDVDTGAENKTVYLTIDQILK